MARLFVILLMVVFAACDRCRNVDCAFGTCEKGGCKCDTGYVGDVCDLQNKPAAIRITSVTMEDVPSEVLGGRWDNDTSTSTAFLPDVMLQVRFGTSQEVEFNSREKYFDNQNSTFTFKEQMNIRVPNSFPEIRFTLADLDFDKYASMYVISVSGYYDPTGGFPGEYELVNEDGVRLLMKMEYTF